MTKEHQHAINLSNLSRRFQNRRKKPPRTALDNLSLTIDPGQTLALLGPNGSGKSTLINLVLGIDTPDAGTAEVLGSAAGTNARRAGAVAALHQTVGLDALLTVRENLNLQARLYNIKHPAQRIQHAANTTGIHDRLDERVANLSGGLARRADLARTLLVEPAVLVLDEPAAGLDITARDNLAHIIAQRRGIHAHAAVLISTHHTEIAAAAHIVALINNGRITQQDRPTALITRTVGGASRVRFRTAAAAPITPPNTLTLHTIADHTIAAGHPADTAAFAAQLTRDGIPAAAGPATLEDAYAIATGNHLDSNNANTQSSAA